MTQTKKPAKFTRIRDTSIEILATKVIYTFLFSRVPRSFYLIYDIERIKSNCWKDPIHHQTLSNSYPNCDLQNGFLVSLQMKPAKEPVLSIAYLRRSGGVLIHSAKGQ